ncbi:MAG: Phosphatidate cytidylyltransferase [uncultured Sphingomonadaceae bacterium]|uniref:Phosphatidate cytidylyltransferase n=1 Tax=uncultured Sphingomonadaceae bacterium TaxID=169976 RepID=A0A6J4RU19_9SPHN|nr:MAG: Phosphatidate cytidylyltransferase [uncultured Sphingomonadaceae bacterium]
MSDLWTRSVVGVGLVLVALATIVHGGWLFVVFVALVACVILFEWRRLTDGWGFGWSTAGFVYALLPALALLWLRERPEVGAQLVLWTMAVTWATDILAYFAGRAIGGPKLAPAVSPNKTWAGLLGGVLGATAVSALIVSTAGLSSRFNLFAPLLAVAAQGGDLFESWLKRRAGAKDSGTLLPGHGGAMDRLDGLVPVACLSFLLVAGGVIAT